MNIKSVSSSNNAGIDTQDVLPPPCKKRKRGDEHQELKSDSSINGKISNSGQRNLRRWTKEETAQLMAVMSGSGFSSELLSTRSRLSIARMKKSISKSSSYPRNIHPPKTEKPADVSTEKKETTQEGSVSSTIQNFTPFEIQPKAIVSTSSSSLDLGGLKYEGHFIPRATHPRKIEKTGVISTEKKETTQGGSVSNMIQNFKALGLQPKKTEKPADVSSDNEAETQEDAN